MNLVLVGYRGTGKSTIARLAASILGRDVVSTDALIVERAGCAIPEFVAAHGWPAFRDLEAAVVAENAAGNGRVIDCGGGVVLRPENVIALRTNGFVAWLTAPIPVLAARIGGDANRPSLTGKPIDEEIREVLLEREPLYRAAADLVVETANETAEECAKRIATRLREAEAERGPNGL